MLRARFWTVYSLDSLSHEVDILPAVATGAEVGLSAGLRRIDSFDERTSSPTRLVSPGFFILSKFSKEQTAMTLIPVFLNDKASVEIDAEQEWLRI